jgi:hypothetical protein
MPRGRPKGAKKPPPVEFDQETPVDAHEARQDAALAEKANKTPDIVDAYQAGSIDGVELLEHWPFAPGTVYSVSVRREFGPDEMRGTIYLHRDVRDPAQVKQIVKHTACCFGTGRYSAHFMTRTAGPYRAGLLRIVSFTLTAERVDQYLAEATDKELEQFGLLGKGGARVSRRSASRLERPDGDGEGDPVLRRLDDLSARMAVLERPYAPPPPAGPAITVEGIAALIGAVAQLIPKPGADAALIAETFKAGLESYREIAEPERARRDSEEWTDRLVDALAESTLPDKVGELVGAFAKRLARSPAAPQLVGASPSASPSADEPGPEAAERAEQATGELVRCVVDSFKRGVPVAEVAALVKPFINGAVETFAAMPREQLAQSLASFTSEQLPQGFVDYVGGLQGCLKG